MILLRSDLVWRQWRWHADMIRYFPRNWLTPRYVKIYSMSELWKHDFSETDIVRRSEVSPSFGVVGVQLGCLIT